MVFLLLQQKSGLYSRVKAGMALQTSCLFSDIKTPV